MPLLYFTRNHKYYDPKVSDLTLMLKYDKELRKASYGLSASPECALPEKVSFWFCDEFFLFLGTMRLFDVDFWYKNVDPIIVGIMHNVQGTHYLDYMLASNLFSYSELLPFYAMLGELEFTKQFLMKTPAIMPYPWQLLFQFPSSPFMDKLDNLNNFIMEFLIVIVTFVLVWLYFLLSRFTYSMKSVDDPSPKMVQMQHNSFLEFIWTVIPFLILLVIFSSSAALIYDGANKTNMVNTIKVIGNQWYWKYSYTVLAEITSLPYALSHHWPTYIKAPTLINVEYDAYMRNNAVVYTYLDPDFMKDDPYYPGSGPVTLYMCDNDPLLCDDPSHITMEFDLSRFDTFKRLLWTDYQLFMPAKEWLRFLISSADVIHSWALPAFGMKCDAVPGRINEVMSLVSMGGEYFGQCSELCGINHGFMPIHIWAYVIPESS